MNTGQGPSHTGPSPGGLQTRNFQLRPRGVTGSVALPAATLATTTVTQGSWPGPWCSASVEDSRVNAPSPLS